MNDLQQFEQQQVQKQIDRMGEKKIPDFAAGDTVRVNVKIVEKTEKETRHRIQAYEGVCIARGGDAINQSFTVRKISYGEGVERVFPLFSPTIDSIELVRRGSVRRAKLYYLRDLSGKAARITERDTRAEEANKAAQTAINNAPASEKKAVNA